MAPKPTLGDYSDVEEEENGPAPIGVPRDYVVERGETRMGTADAAERWATSEVEPLYWSGAQWTEARTLSPEDRASLQLVLKQMGLIPQGTRVVLGAWDDASASAFREVLAWANVNGVGWRTALGQMVESQQQFGAMDPSGEELPAFVAEVSNPKDVARSLKDTIREAVGSGAVSKADLDSWVSEFQGAQVGAQRAAYDASLGGGGTVVAPPSIDTFADEKAKQKDPVAYDAYKALDKFSVILNAMGGGNAVGS